MVARDEWLIREMCGILERGKEFVKKAGGEMVMGQFYKKNYSLFFK